MQSLLSGSAFDKSISILQKIFAKICQQKGIEQIHVFRKNNTILIIKITVHSNRHKPIQVVRPRIRPTSNQYKSYKTV
jgi:hypothetical protein